MGRRFLAVSLAALASLGAACESEMISLPPGEGEGEGEVLECVGANDCPLGSYCSEFGRCVESELIPGSDGGPGTLPLPSDNEEEARRPASGLRYVYVAMTDLDTVARIDAETLDIRTLPVGDRPGEIVTAPGQDLAVVINHGSDSVTVIRTDDDGNDELTTLPTPPHLNRVEMDPAGRHAIVYFELLSADATDVGSFQDVVVIRLAAGEESAFNVSVGFRPRRVVFDPDGSSAYIHTDDGVSIVNLEGTDSDFFAPNRPLSGPGFGDGALDDNQPLEVVIARDGSHAFARFAEKSFVRAVSLDDGSHTDIALAGPPSDIDLSDDAAKLVAVVAETASLVVLPLPAAISEPTAAAEIDCTPLTVGLVELSADGERAVVFTNAIAENAIGVVDLDSASLDIVALRKAVSTVSFTPDGEKVLVVHNKVPGEPSPLDDFETQLTHRHGFSLVDLSSLFAKLQLTEARPGAVSFQDDGSALHLIVADPQQGLRDVVAVDLTSLVATSLPMSSHPTDIGSMPLTGRVFVAQRHDLGRMSFLDVVSGEVRTVTGFQLNSQITE